VEHRPSLDGLRGLAVAAVVLFHFEPTLVPGGFLGVDLFFVLSGFLITSLLLAERRRSGHTDVKTFWGRRARRLLPAALVTLAGIAVHAGVTATASSTLRAELASGLFYVNNWYQIMNGQSYIAIFTTPSPVTHFWSLAIEEQFYLVWPLLFVIAGWIVARRPRAGRHARAIVTTVVIVATALSAGWMWYLSVLLGDPSRAYYGTDTRAFEILIGVLLALLIGSPERVQNHAVLSGVGAIAAVSCISAMFFWSQTTDFYYRGGALLWSAGIALVIAAALPFGGPVADAFSLKPLCLLGVISYGVYLYHFPVMLWVSEASTGQSGISLFAIRTVLTLAAATASFFALEAPIRRRTFPLAQARAKLIAPAAVAAVLVLIVVLAAPGSNRSGLAFASGSGRPVPRDQAIDLANKALIYACAGGQPLAEYRDNGTGRLVAVIGDSMTTQIRENLLQDQRYDWFVIASCGTSIRHFDDHIAGEPDMADEAFTKLESMHPKALIVDLGIADIARRYDYLASLPSFLERTRMIPCRSWVMLWPNPEVDVRLTGGSEEFARFNAELTAAVKDTNVKLLDWGARASAVPLNEFGYHPWINPDDGIHLLPGPSFEEMHELMVSGLEGCF